MNIFDAYPSDYLKASDLQDRNVTVIMDRVEVKKLGNDTKPVLYFRGKEKGLALNITNSNTIAGIYGDETEDWAGKELVLYPTMTDYMGESVPCIRVKVPTRERQRDVPRDIPLPAAVIAQRPNGNGTHRPTIRTELNDEVPF